MEMNILKLSFVILEWISVSEFLQTTFVYLIRILCPSGNLHFVPFLTLLIRFSWYIYSKSVRRLLRSSPIQRLLRWGLWLAPSEPPLGDCVMGFSAGATSGFCIKYILFSASLDKI